MLIYDVETGSNGLSEIELSELNTHLDKQSDFTF